MNYVILNGVPSTDITGLLIQQLPPVVKPLIRTEIEEIDGRDGDIVTKLGYSAYNREMSIGLYGKFKIDDVVKYFDSEGTVIFSNEPDKFYKYQIIEQIDFERLVRFRTATVVFHCQPFKYSAVEKTYTMCDQALTLSRVLESKSGITFDGHGDSIRISGESTVAVEMYVPVSANLDGSYTLTSSAKGTGATHVTFRLIENTPVDSDTFGGQATTAGALTSLSATVTKSYNYLYLYITAGTIDITLDFALTDDSVNSMSVINSGNTVSKPIYTISGIGTVNVSLNGKSLSIAFSGADTVTIDIDAMEAYNGEVLKNRIITGEYDDLKLKVGTNLIEWSGVVSEISLLNYSRWI